MNSVPFHVNCGSIEMKRIQMRANTPQASPPTSPAMSTSGHDTRSLEDGRIPGTMTRSCLSSALGIGANGRDTLQLVLAGILERDARTGHQVFDGLRDKDL